MVRSSCGVDVTSMKRPHLTCLSSKHFAVGCAKKRTTISLREILGDAATQIAKLAPEIETRLGPFPERQELAPHEERLLFFDAVVTGVFQLRAPPVAALLRRRPALGRSRHALAVGPSAASTSQRARSDRRRLSRNRTRSRASARQSAGRLESRTANHTHRFASLQRNRNRRPTRRTC